MVLRGSVPDGAYKYANGDTAIGVVNRLENGWGVSSPLGGSTPSVSALQIYGALA